jgi:hypothetical protein
MEPMVYHEPDEIENLLNRRLQGRVDDSDILQDAYLEAARKLSDYFQDPRAPFFLWLRRITGDKLLEVHRTHLGTRMRDADREVSLHRGALPAASSVSLAALLLGRLTSPSQAAVKAEMRIKFASGGEDRMVRIWQPETGALLLALGGHEAHVNAVAWSPDGLRLASGDSDGVVRVWDARPRIPLDWEICRERVSISASRMSARCNC